jgi:F-type H+-transporting ATPase subunit epsilon
MADKYLNVEIITPGRIVYSDLAVSVNVPGSLSPFEVLYNHAPIVSALDNGIIKITAAGSKSMKYICSTGFVEVSKNKVSILVEKADEIENVNSGLVNKNIAIIQEKLNNPEISDGEKSSLKKELKFEEFRLTLLNREHSN